MAEKENPFRTIIEKLDFPFKISHKSGLMYIGSCFTENIGNKTKELKFNADINPFGILYNPVSIKKAVDFIIRKKEFSEEELFLKDEIWHSFYHHSRFSGINKEETLQNINNRISESNNRFENADYFFVTFGTSWIYEHKELQIPVANCHKYIQNTFKKRLLNADEITVEYFQLLNNLQNFNPNLKIIFTVSPVRHFKDGSMQNLISKSILVIAIQQIIEQFENCFYFPAYEIMNDDLRDYRFYSEDMIHPNKIANDYIFKYFSESFFSKDTKNLNTEIIKINKAANHRAFSPNTEKHKQFLRKNFELIANIEKKHPEIDFSDEKLIFKA